MLNPGDEVFLRGARFGCHEDGIVAADIANNFRPVAAIKSEGNSLCSADRGSYDEQVGARGLNGSQQIANRAYVFVIVATARGQLVAVAGLDRTELFEVATDARLRRRIALCRQCRYERSLRSRRTLQQHLSYRITTFLMVSVGHSASRIDVSHKYAHKLNIMRINSQPSIARFSALLSYTAPLYRLRSK